MAPAGVPKPGVPDPEHSRREAARRARTKMRRYCAANRLNRMDTLTYRGEGCQEPREARRHIGLFFRGLRNGIGGEAFPYAWVPEWHPGGHGIHLHFAVGQFVRRSLIEQTWGRGFIKLKLLGDLPVGSTTLNEARVAARYLAKYIGKDFDEKPAGVHRYDVAEGFQPPSETVFRRSREAALYVASARMSCPPTQVWFPDDSEQWDGPPAVWASWG